MVSAVDFGIKLGNRIFMFELLRYYATLHNFNQKIFMWSS